MRLSPGTRVGPYEVVAPLGFGGMGEVYRARDTTLHRDVALKVLPELVASDPERLARFKREAQVLASLDHPHIAAIHGFEDAPAHPGEAGTQALVMEFVDGDTLAAIIEREQGKGLPASDAIAVALQIADALEAAHDRGIVHRDLKPANVKVRTDGKVKVLDFGLAKALDPVDRTGHPQMTHSPTITSPAMTQTGVILGTAAYMSPEQARGRSVDKRTDIWAFGCVLFEMLSGTRAFGGDDVTDTIAAVVRAEPDWASLPADTPHACRRIMRRCLEKDLSKRLKDIGDARLELATPDEEVGLKSNTGVRLKPDSTAVKPASNTWLVAAVAALAAGVTVGAGAWLLRRDQPLPTTRSDIIAAPGATLLAPSVGNVDVSISDDGRTLAYLVARGTVEQLYVRSLDELEEKLLLTSSPAEIRGPAISTDGKWIAYVRETTQALEKISTAGDKPIALAKVTGNVRGIAWSGNHTIFFATNDPATGIQRVSASGGTPENLTTPGDRTEDHLFPWVLPGGQGVLYTVFSGTSATARTEVFDLGTRETRTILKGGVTPRYVEPGYLLDSDGSSLRATVFDRVGLEGRSATAVVVRDVATKPNGAAQYAVSPNGTLFYIRGSGESQSTVVWVDRSGKEEPTGVPAGEYAYARLSPDNRKVALDTRGRTPGITIWDLERGTTQQLTRGETNRSPVWTSDSKRVTFSMQRDGKEQLVWQNADGTGAPEPLTEGDRPQVPAEFTPDGKGLAYIEPNSAPFDIGLLDLTTHKRALLFHDATYSESNPVFSPDGRWIAYQSNESARDEIYVRPFPNVDAGKLKVSTEGGTRPAWSRDGAELFYFVAPGRLFSVAFRKGEAQPFAVPRVIIDGRYSAPNSGRQTDVSQDGRRFLMLKPAGNPDGRPNQFVLVQNWIEELSELVPAR